MSRNVINVLANVLDHSAKVTHTSQPLRLKKVKYKVQLNHVQNIKIRANKRIKKQTHIIKCACNINSY